MIVRQKGFTLIEIAIVLLIVSILLGYTLAMFPAQQNLKNYRAVSSKIEEIKNNLIAYAQVNGRLPCPDIDADGLENTIDVANNNTGAIIPGGDTFIDGCVQYRGQVPYGTLGLSGDVDNNGIYVDPWGEQYRYSISNVASLGAVVDLVSANAVRTVGISNLTASDLFICNDSAVLGGDNDCADAGSNLVAGEVSVVIVSTGKDKQTIASNIQAENLDADNVYVSNTLSGVSGSEFDDVVKWISPNILYSKMIEAGQLP